MSDYVGWDYLWLHGTVSFKQYGGIWRARIDLYRDTPEWLFLEGNTAKSATAAFHELVEYASREYDSGNLRAVSGRIKMNWKDNSNG